MVAKGDEIIEDAPLPIGGVVSDEPMTKLGEKLVTLDILCKTWDIKIQTKLCHFQHCLYWFLLK